MISVLFVDDEPELLDTVRMFLERSGDVKVMTAVSGEECLKILAGQHIDAIVSDYLMPGMDGIRLLREVRCRYPGIPFLIFTGRGREEVVIEALNNGANFYLRKEEDAAAGFAILDHRIREAVQRRIVGDEEAKIQCGELTKCRQAHEELQAAYRKLSATDSALRENYRSLLEEQAALKEEGDKYRNLFEAESDAVLLVDDRSGAILEANAAASALYGYSRDELLTRTAGDLLASTGAEDPAGEPLPVIGSVVTIPVLNHKRSDGSIVPVEITERHFTLRERSVCMVTVRDISRRRQAARTEQERIDRTMRYQKALVQLATADAPTLRAALNRITETGASVLQADRVGIWFFSKDGENLLCNEVYIRSSGTHTFEPAISGTDRPSYLAMLQEKRAIVVADARNNDPTGKPAATRSVLPGGIARLDIPIRSGKTVIGLLRFEQTGHPRNWEIEDQDFAIAVADYTANILEQAKRRLAEKDFRRSERKYRAVVDRANDGIVILQDGLFRFANPKAVDILGYTEEELEGTPFIAKVAQVEQAKISEWYRQRVTGSEISRIHDTVLVKKNGQPAEVELNAGTMEFDGKSSDLVFIRDITDRKRSERALLLANQKLNLLSGITRHDILNKLTVVIGYLELAKSTRDRGELVDFIRKIDDNLQVVEDQVQFTRDYQDMGLKEPEWQNCAEVFDGVVSQLDTSRVRVLNRLNGFSVFADPLFAKVLYNIVDNALRYGDTITEITASFEKNGEDAVLIIEDNGVGIPAKEKGRIFEKGFGHHTGLGLFLAKEILSLTGIEIMETGFPSRGARFEIRIPAGRFRINN